MDHRWLPEHWRPSLVWTGEALAYDRDDQPRLGIGAGVSFTEPDAPEWWRDPRWPLTCDTSQMRVGMMLNINNPFEQWRVDRIVDGMHMLVEVIHPQIDG